MYNLEKPVFHNHNAYGFIDINGLPYLLGEYLDRRRFQQIDRSMIKSEIFIDQSESMRAVVDVSIDDTCKKMTNDKMTLFGNSSNQVDFIKMIESNYRRLDHHLNVLRRGIRIRVNYHLENNRTGQVIRSMVEDLFIKDRYYFLEINPTNINDNIMITNFSNSMVSTVNQFTHGSNTMIMRITNIQLFYECVKTPTIPRYGTERNYGEFDVLPSYYGNERSMYEYNERNQRHFNIDGNNYDNINVTVPPDWSLFNTFYHFENSGHSLKLHNEEIYDKHTNVMLIPCGSIQVNRSFMINPGHRIIFKFSIWKNDVIIFNDPSLVAKALRAPVINPYYSPMPCVDICHPDIDNNHCINPDNESLLRMYQSSRDMDYEQNAVINKLTSLVSELTSALKGEESESEEALPMLPELPKDPPKCDHPHNQIFNQIFDMIRSLQDQINSIKGEPTEGDDDKCDHIPMPDEVIVDSVENANNETES